MPRPSFFIVGAARCGTTALCNYLREHPAIYIPPQKELNYFTTDMRRPRAANSEQEYLRFFDSAGDVIAGEGSVWDLYSRSAIPAILAFEPKARIIIHVRNPMDWFISWHAHRVYTLNENLVHPEAAWRAQADRAQGRRIPPFCLEPELLAYGPAGRFGEQVRRALAVVPRDQVLFIVYEDFAASPGTVYRKVLNFLGVSDDGRRNFSRWHETKRHRSLWLARQLLRPKGRSLELWRLLKKAGLAKQSREMLLQINTAYGYRVPLAPAFRRELINYFAADVNELSRLLGRDLGHWLIAGNEC